MPRHVLFASRSRYQGLSSIVRRLDWAARYRMNDLQNDLFNSLEDLETLGKVGDDPEWVNMCEAAKTGFMEVFFRINKMSSNQRFPSL
ncbi:unnamed protein product [Caenorhabditis auriculariae]|uniref:Uncharacterized protein n=1 Tax=Caenorhabditis auriculariae TaxID=2777116 RepID=A0A8S1HTW4_9PELO|nr:unnamed protein product [Caenorhabditis auriculariae]